MPQSHSTIASAAGLIARTLEDYDINPRELFDKAGIDVASIDDPSGRFPAHNMQALWRLVLDATKDECFGIAAGERIQPAAMHGVGFAWLASDTLYDALKRLVHYQRVLSTVAKFSLEEADGVVRLVLNTRPLGFDIENATLEMAMAAFITMCRLASASEFSPMKVTLRRTKPVCSQRIEACFRAPIEYDADENCLCFRNEDLRVPLPNANTELARANDQVVIDYLSRFDRSQLSMQVRSRIIESLPAGQPTQGEIAAAMNMSLRNLQRKLHAEGTNFRTLLDETRRELATQYIRETHRSVAEITYLLGFAESSNFTRAFRRWTGMSPNAFRQQG